jgi:predicted deacylase
LELGSEESLSSHEAKEDAARIIHYLHSKGLDIENPPFIKRPEQKYSLLKNYKTYYSPFAGLVEYLKSPGDSFKKGDILARVLNFGPVQESKDLKMAWKEILALDAGIVINHSPTGVIHEGNEIFQIMTHFKFC